MFDIPKEEKKDPNKVKNALDESKKFTDSLPDPDAMIAQMTADREASEAEEQARLNEANITTPTLSLIHI
mgnify:FL=1